VALFALVACAMLFVSAEQWLLRWRAEQLLADMQAIRLHHSTWPEAQALMHRWGARGHYEGSCTAVNCRYEIDLLDFLSANAVHLPEGRLRWAIFNPASLNAYRWLGGRIAGFHAGFIVQDGTIWRTFQNVQTDVPPHTPHPEKLDYGEDYELIAIVQSRSSLNSNGPVGAHWIMGSDEQLAVHPDYKAGTPSGCEACMATEVTYSVATPPDEIRPLTGFDLSCLTRWHPCTLVEELLPASRPWHLHAWSEDNPPAAPASTALKACDIPVWALGRDAISVFAIDTLSSQTRKAPEGREYEQAEARLAETLKGTAPWAVGTVLSAFPYSGDEWNSPNDPPEHLAPGSRYLALVTYSFHEFDRDDPPLPPGLIDGKPGIRLDRCGILPDTPQNRAELRRGMAMNDHLRVAEF
jgi:hypothetical protein